MRKKYFAYKFMSNCIYISQNWGYEMLLNFRNIHITIHAQFESISNLNAQFLDKRKQIFA